MKIPYRFLGLFIGSLVVLGTLFNTDPDNDFLSTKVLVLSLLTPIMAIALAHIYRKVLHDYPEADMRRLFRIASESPVGAGLALVGLSMVLSALLGLFGRAAHAAETPHPRAVALAAVMSHELTDHWPDIPTRFYVPALISHESCITYTHSKCWASTSRLKTQREEGAGLGQITRAYRLDGSLRFDTLAELRDHYPSLSELNWKTIYERPDLQIRALILLSRSNWLALRAVADPTERLRMTDVSYNQGLSGTTKDRRACGMRTGCDPQRWSGNVETTCMASKQILYGQRSACDISRHHVKDVWARMSWYKGLPL